MKKLCFLGLMFFAALHCSAQRGFYEYKVTALPVNDATIIYAEASGIGKNEKEAYSNAAANVFNAILYTGLPGSAQTSALVPEEAKAKSEHAAIMSCFTSFDCYNRFIISTEEVGTPTKEKRNRIVGLRVKINLTALRTYLEENNVLRKFGF